MKLDDILHVMATNLGTEVVSLRDRDIPARAGGNMIPAKVARMYHCVPVALKGSTVQVALADPLDPAQADEIQFASKHDVQVVVADPVEIEKTLDRLYGQEESESVSEILKELGADTDIAREASEADADDEKSS